MVALRASTVVAALLALTLAFSSSSSSSSSSPRSFLLVHSANAAETKTVNLQPFVGVSICAPISVRIVDSNSSDSGSGGQENSNSKGFSARLTGDRKAIDAVSLTTTASSLSVELPRGGDVDVGGATPLELEIRLPAGTLQYVERVHAPGDTAILSEFDREKAEVASSGAGNIWVPFLNGRGRGRGGGGGGGGEEDEKEKKKAPRLQMAKFSLSAPGKVVVQGEAGFWEVFTSDDDADVRIDGVVVGGGGGGGNDNGGGNAAAAPLYSTVSVRLDAGRARIQPFAPSSEAKNENVVAITGFALAPRNARAAELEYTSGECSARREAFGGRLPPASSASEGDDDASLPALGSACKLVAPLPSPPASSSPPPMAWTCGVRFSGKWTCGGPGDRGARPGTVVGLGSGAGAGAGSADRGGCAASREELASISRV